MHALTRITRIVLVTFFLAAGSTAAAADNGIEGFWEIQGTPDGAPGPAFTNLSRIGKDGALTNLDPWFGAGLGQWEKTGPGQYAISFTHYFLDGPNVGEINVTATGWLSEDRQGFHGEFLTEISFGGLVVDSFGGTVAAARK